MQFWFLGHPRITINDVEMQLPFQKAIALLAFLAISGKPHKRRKLASLLWGERGHSRAQNSLRNALFVIRREAAPIAILDSQRDLVSLVPSNDQNPIWLDTAEFQTRIQQQKEIDPLPSRSSGG